MVQDRAIEYWQIGIYNTDTTTLREYSNEFEAMKVAQIMVTLLLKSANSCPVNIAVYQSIGNSRRMAYIVNKEGIFAYQRPLADTPG